MIIIFILFIGLAVGLYLPYKAVWEYYGKDPQMIKEPWTRIVCTIVAGTGVLLIIYFVLYALVK